MAHHSEKSAREPTPSCLFPHGAGRPGGGKLDRTPGARCLLLKISPLGESPSENTFVPHLPARERSATAAVGRVRARRLSILLSPSRWLHSRCSYTSILRICWTDMRCLKS